MKQEGLEKKLLEKEETFVSKYGFRSIDSFTRIFLIAKDKEENVDFEKVEGIGEIFKATIKDGENSIIVKFTEEMVNGGRETETSIEFFFIPRKMNTQQKLDLFNTFEETMRLYKDW